jgi:hypothetical protein
LDRCSGFAFPCQAIRSTRMDPSRDYCMERLSSSNAVPAQLADSWACVTL